MIPRYPDSLGRTESFRVRINSRARASDPACGTPNKVPKPNKVSPTTITYFIGFPVRIVACGATAPLRAGRTICPGKLYSPALPKIKAGLGENEVVAAFRSEGMRQANIQFVRLAFCAVDGSVVPQRVARLDSLQQRAENRVQVSHVLHVENLSAGLIHDFANIYEAGNHARCKNRHRRVVSGNFQVIEGGVRGDRFRHNVTRSLSTRVRPDIVAD